MAKKKTDKLALDMIQCKKDGYGCRYGAWKATQATPAPGIPEGFKACKRCGKLFKPRTANQVYCNDECQYLARLDAKRKKD